MTPFSLVFGRNQNNFEDFTCKQSNYEINEIYNRTLEIKKFFEETIPKAKENVAKAQVRQKATKKNEKI
jgi:hypothetical protein